MKEEKEIVPMDFAEYFRKSGVSEKSKVSWNEKCCYISKSRWNGPPHALSHWAVKFFKKGQLQGRLKQLVLVQNPG